MKYAQIDSLTFNKEDSPVEIPYITNKEEPNQRQK